MNKLTIAKFGGSAIGIDGEGIPQIIKRIKEIDNREWNFVVKKQQDNVNITNARIKAARDVGVSYGTNQPKETYNIRSWW
mgnify:CR=1 FL=1